MMVTRIMSRFSTVLIYAAGIALCVFAAWYNAPARLGKRGEERVTLHLQNELPENALILNDIYLPLADGSTTQIDHIVILESGIFVIETKTYSGWIFGRANDLKWTQTIYRKKSTFQNPIRQNALHINTLAKTLGLSHELLTGVVVFAGDCEFKTEMPPTSAPSPRTPGQHCRATDNNRNLRFTNPPENCYTGKQEQGSPCQPMLRSECCDEKLLAGLPMHHSRKAVICEWEHCRRLLPLGGELSLNIKLHGGDVKINLAGREM